MNWLQSFYLGTTTHDFYVKRFGQALLLLTIWLLPLQTRWIALPGSLNNKPWEYGTVSMFGIDILIILCATLASIVRMKQQRALSMFEYSALLLVFVACFSFSQSTNHINAIWGGWLMTSGILLCLSLVWLSPPRNWLIWTMITSGVLQSGLALWQHHEQTVTAMKWLGIAAQDPSWSGVQVIEVGSQRILRAYGSLPHPNILAGYLAITICLAVSALLWSKHYKNQLSIAGVIAILTTALMTTYSRQALLGLGVGLGYMCLMTLLQRQRFPFRMVLALMCVFIPLTVSIWNNPAPWQARYQAQTRLEQRSLDERTTYQDQAIALLRDHWLGGVGINNFTAVQHAHDRRANITRDGYSYQPVHNMYLLLWTELGIMGVLTMLMVVISSWHTAARSSAWQLDNRAALLTLLTIGCFDHYLWSLHAGILLWWCVIGLLAWQKKVT